MLECIVDSREQFLFHDLEKYSSFPIPFKTRMLEIGDVLFQTEKGEILLLIERKTVRDLVHSLKDGRYHDQRNRWHEFLKDSPHSTVSLWIEGDLMTTDMEEQTRSSLLNSLLRLQTRHHIVVHQVHSREGFLKSLQMVAQKFQQDPYHLVMKLEDTILTPSLGQYKKSAHSEENYWQSCLALIPGISTPTALKITTLYPNLSLFVQQYQENPQEVLTSLTELKINEKRKLGGKQAQKIVRFLFPTTL
jgi:ERCC4-type nuclease